MTSTTPTPPKNRSIDNIRKHGSGWQARTCVDGVKASKTFPTKNEAKLWITLKRREWSAASVGGYEPARRMRAADLFREHAAKNVSKMGGARQETSRLRLLADLPWSQKPLLEVLPDDVDALMAQFKVAGPTGKPLSEDTRRLYFAAIAGAFNYAIRKLRWHFLANPTVAADKPQPSPYRRRIPTPDEEARIVAGLRAAPTPHYLNAFLILIASTMRMGELFRVRWTDVDLDARIIYLDRDKAGGGREVPLSLDMLLLLEQVPREGEMLIPVKRAAFESFWKGLLERLGIKNLRLHDLRRLGATRWGKLLENPNLLKVVTGHRTLIMVGRYINTTTGDALSAMDDATSGDPLFDKFKRSQRKPVLPLSRYLLDDNTEASTPACDTGAKCQQPALRKTA
jgi:integrase